MKIIKNGIGFGVSGIVIKNGNFLVTQRNDTKAWTLPGGGLENGESPEDAVKREVKEETGLEIEPLSLTGIYVRNKWRNNLLFVYKCKIVSGALKKSAETDDFKWLKISNASSETILDANCIERVNDCANFSGNTLLKLQNKTTIKQIILWLRKDLHQMIYGC